MSRTFTGKERDSETGLDYLGARYLSSAQGRFTTPDPLLNSGRPWNPQSWNRYAYVLNNPLKYLDPTGLYDFGACTGMTEQCAAWRARVDAGIDAARAALASGKLKQGEADELRRVLGYLGSSGDSNGVVISFGKISGAATGRLIGKNQIQLDMANIDARLLDPRTFRAGYSKTAEVGATTIHEGTHGRDLAYGIYDFSLRSDTEEHINQDLIPFRDAEVRAYDNESFVYKGLNVSESGGESWNLSWKVVDREKMRSAGVQAAADRSTQAARDELEERRRKGQ